MENYVYISKHCGICIANNGYICLGENNKIGESIDLTAKNNSEIRFGNKVQVRRSGCTSQQKVDTTLYFYTSFNEHNTPYTVLESDNSESMPDVLH